MMGEACGWVHSTVRVAPSVYRRRKTHALTGEIVVLPGWWVRVAWGGKARRQTYRKCATEAEATEAKASMQESVVAEADAEIAAWLDRFTMVSPDGMVSKKDLCVSYNAAAEGASRPLISPKAFFAAVRRLRPTVKDAQRGASREGEKKVFVGLAMNDAVAVEGMTDVQQASRAARVALEALQVLLAVLEWPEDEELIRALSACRQIEECAS